MFISTNYIRRAQDERIWVREDQANFLLVQNASSANFRHGDETEDSFPTWT